MYRRLNLIQRQKGMTLVELLVGLTIGLIVIGVATAALLTSHRLGGTVSDATTMQQAASYAFRVIGAQVRQAGSIELNLHPNLSFATPSNSFAAMQPVAFDAPDPSGSRPTFNSRADTVFGTNEPALTVGYQNYVESVTSDADAESLLRDCLGQNPGKADPVTAPVLSSTFKHSAAKNELQCIGTGNTEPIIGNVTGFQIRYIIQPARSTTLQYVSDPGSISKWETISAVEVCLELTGTEIISGIDGETDTYTDCTGQFAKYNNRIKRVFRNVYQLRSRS